MCPQKQGTLYCNSTDNSNDFQADLDKLYGWCINNRLNVNKYILMTFTHRRAYDSFNYNIEINSQLLHKLKV